MMSGLTASLLVMHCCSSAHVSNDTPLIRAVMSPQPYDLKIWPRARQEAPPPILENGNRAETVWQWSLPLRLSGLADLHMDLVF
jgi:hypothetical protein